MVKFFIAILALFAVGLSGCATTTEEGNSLRTTDGQYVHAVERQARRLGVRVEWVNPPRARVRDAERREPQRQRDGD